MPPLSKTRRKGTVVTVGRKGTVSYLDDGDGNKEHVSIPTRHPDLEFICNGDGGDGVSPVRVFAHRFVVAAHSRFLWRLMRRNVASASSSEVCGSLLPQPVTQVVLPEISPDSVRAVVRFLYTGFLPLRNQEQMIEVKTLVQDMLKLDTKINFPKHLSGGDNDDEGQEDAEVSNEETEAVMEASASSPTRSVAFDDGDESSREEIGEPQDTVAKQQAVPPMAEKEGQGAKTPEEEILESELRHEETEEAREDEATENEDMAVEEVKEAESATAGKEVVEEDGDIVPSSSPSPPPSPFHSSGGTEERSQDGCQKEVSAGERESHCQTVVTNAADDAAAGGGGVTFDDDSDSDDEGATRVSGVVDSIINSIDECEKIAERVERANKERPPAADGDEVSSKTEQASAAAAAAAEKSDESPTAPKKRFKLNYELEQGEGGRPSSTLGVALALVAMAEETPATESPVTAVGDTDEAPLAAATASSSDEGSSVEKVSPDRETPLPPNEKSSTIQDDQPRDSKTESSGGDTAAEADECHDEPVTEPVDHGDSQAQATDAEDSGADKRSMEDPESEDPEPEGSSSEKSSDPSPPTEEGEEAAPPSDLLAIISDGGLGEVVSEEVEKQVSEQFRAQDYTYSSDEDRNGEDDVASSCCIRSPVPSSFNGGDDGDDSDTDLPDDVVDGMDRMSVDISDSDDDDDNETTGEAAPGDKEKADLVDKSKDKEGADDSQSYVSTDLFAEQEVGDPSSESSSSACSSPAKIGTQSVLPSPSPHCLAKKSIWKKIHDAKESSSTDSEDRAKEKRGATPDDLSSSDDSSVASRAPKRKRQVSAEKSESPRPSTSRGLVVGVVQDETSEAASTPTKSKRGRPLKKKSPSEHPAYTAETTTPKEKPLKLKVPEQLQNTIPKRKRGRPPKKRPISEPPSLSPAAPPPLQVTAAASPAPATASHSNDDDALFARPTTTSRSGRKRKLVNYFEDTNSSVGDAASLPPSSPRSEAVTEGGDDAESVGRESGGLDDDGVFKLPPPIPARPNEVVFQGNWRSMAYVHRMAEQRHKRALAQMVKNKLRKYSYQRGKGVTGKQVNSLVDNSTGEFPCPLCGVRFERARSLKVHMGRQHHPNPKGSCEECGARLASKNSLKKHLLKHRPREQWPFQCPLCFRPFQAKGDIPKHLASGKHKDVVIPEQNTPEWDELMEQTERLKLPELTKRKRKPNRRLIL